jgi:quinoprotein relay system zinc metallohydrolase 2
MAGADCTAVSSVTEIAPGAFVRQGTIELPTEQNAGAIANVGFIVGDQSVAVIDTGGSLCGGLALREAIGKHTELPIRYVINTHMHPDHIFGNAAFTDDGAQIIGHHNLPRSLSDRAGHYLESYERQIGAQAMEGTRIVGPSVLVEDELRIDLGGRELVIEAHEAAHTDNDLTVYDTASGVLWTGDLVFLGHVPVLDGSIAGWLSVMDELMQHEATRIVPGHGPAISPWPEAGENQHRYLKRLAEDLRAAIGAGTGIGDAAKHAAETEKDQWRLFGEYNRRNASAAYAELEWE